MIKEDYCSFEVAKLLKDKGFDGESYGIYIDENTFEELDFKSSNSPETSIYRIVTPTHQMAMKWLRKIHLQHIQISYLHGAYREYEYAVINTFNGKAYHEPVSFSSYEEAVEAALKYSLENLI